MLLRMAGLFQERHLRRSAYTLIEMVVVCVIMMLVIALVAPRVGGTSRRMSAEQALTAFRTAFGECAMRARTTGEPLALLLQPDKRVFRVQAVADVLDKDWHPSRMQPLTGADGQGGIISGAQSYPVPEGVEWGDLPDYDDEHDGILYTFYPDGEAAGPELSWSMFGRDYALAVDSVLGRVAILELDEKKQAETSRRKR